jgi:hypothetical protein
MGFYQYLTFLRNCANTAADAEAGDRTARLPYPGTEGLLT